MVNQVYYTSLLFGVVFIWSHPAWSHQLRLPGAFAGGMLAPSLEVVDFGLQVRFNAPAGHSHVAVYLYKGDIKYTVDGSSGLMASAGQTGKAVLASAGSCTIKKGLTSGFYSAIVRSRHVDDIEFGPESPRSNAVLLSGPVAPCAPTVKATGHDSVTVLFTAPPEAAHVTVFFELAGKRMVVDKDTCKLISGPAKAFTAGLGKCVVRGLDANAKYAVTVEAHNGILWGPMSPPASIRILDHLPVAPCAPTVKPTGHDSVTVLFTAPPEAAHVTIYFKVAGKRMVVDKDTCKLKQIPSPSKGSFTADLGKCVVRGLDENTKYAVTLVAHNGIGWGPMSPPTLICTPDDTNSAVITGGRTREERNAELLKRAVDVEQFEQKATAEAGNSRILSRLPKRVKREC